MCAEGGGGWFVCVPYNLDAYSRTSSNRSYRLRLLFIPFHPFLASSLYLSLVFPLVQGMPLKGMYDSPLFLFLLLLLALFRRRGFNDSEEEWLKFLVAEEKFLALTVV